MTDPTAVPVHRRRVDGQARPGRQLQRDQRAPEDPDRAQGGADDDPRLRPRPRRAAAARDVHHRRRRPRRRRRTSSPARRRPARTRRRCPTAARWRRRSRPSRPRRTSRTGRSTSTTSSRARRPRRRCTRSHTLTLDGLKAWSDIPELQDVSGIGRYTTTVDWNGSGGAYLDLGEVFDTYRVTVNGSALPPADQLYTTVDVGPYLKPGANTITVEVATTLLNRLRAGDVAYAGASARPTG